MSAAESSVPPYGMVGEFVRSEEVTQLVRRLRLSGFRYFDVYSPTPIDALDEAVSPRPRRRLVLIMFVGAILGAVLTYFLEYYAAVIGYPINVGGRPYNSWPAFVPIAWEVCALFTVFSGFFAFFLFCRLPLLYHPIFNAPGFERASQDRFFLCIEQRDPHYNPEHIARIFAQYNAVRISEVPQ